MKILLIQSKGKHPENHDFRECLNIKRAMSRQFPEVEVEIWGEGWGAISFPEADVILLMENYNRYWLPWLGDKKALKMFWSIDSHCVLNDHMNLCKNHKIDVVLNSNKCDMKHFENSYSFPSAYPADLIYPLEDRNSKGVGFCGNMLNRGEQLKQLDITPDVMVLGEDMVKAVNSYKIHWNHYPQNYIGYRTYETLGCKTMLLTNETDNLSELFEIGTHLVTYTSMEDCKEKIDYYSCHAIQRESIALAGRNFVRSFHTFDNRVHLLMDIIEGEI
jgi:hypothetical protein